MSSTGSQTQIKTSSVTTLDQADLVLQKRKGGYFVVKDRAGWSGITMTAKQVVERIRRHQAPMRLVVE